MDTSGHPDGHGPSPTTSMSTSTGSRDPISVVLLWISALVLVGGVVAYLLLRP